MDIRIEDNGGQVNINISGVVSTIEETMQAKNAISEVYSKNNDAVIRVIFENSYVITSSLIGFLIKLIRGDKADITIIAKDTQLYNLISRLNLQDILNVKQA